MNREEIAGWLREAATKAALLYGYQRESLAESYKIEKVWVDRATLIESMRCETCIKFQSYYTQVTNYMKYTASYGGDIPTIKTQKHSTAVTGR